MKNMLDEIHKPINISLARKLRNSTLIFITGLILGTLSKILDETSSNLLPGFIEVLDMRNFLSRMGVWLFFGVLIAIYSKSAVRSAINVYLFFTGMVGSYYLYTVFVAGFFPKSYMMIWIMMTVISPFMAYICWYAKGKGLLGYFISTLIILFISRQTFAFGFWYFDILYILELLLWIGTIIVLYQSPKQIVKVTGLGLLLYFITAQINLFWGML